jgi:hypothetical protein
MPGCTPPTGSSLSRDRLMPRIFYYQTAYVEMSHSFQQRAHPMDSQQHQCTIRSKSGRNNTSTTAIWAIAFDVENARHHSVPREMARRLSRS